MENAWKDVAAGKSEDEVLKNLPEVFRDTAIRSFAIRKGIEAKRNEFANKINKGETGFGLELVSQLQETTGKSAGQITERLRRTELNLRKQVNNKKFENKESAVRRAEGLLAQALISTIRDGQLTGSQLDFNNMAIESLNEVSLLEAQESDDSSTCSLTTLKIVQEENIKNSGRETERLSPKQKAELAITLAVLGISLVFILPTTRVQADTAQGRRNGTETWPGETRQEEIQRLPLSFGDAGEFEDEMRSDPVISEHFRKAQAINMSDFWEEQKPGHLQETSMEWIKTVAPDKEFSIPVGGVVPDKIKYKSTKAGMSFLQEDDLEFTYGNHRELFKTLKPGDLIAGENCIYYVEAVNKVDPINQKVLLSGIGGGGGQERVKYFSANINTIEGLVGPWFTMVKKIK